MSVTVRLFAAAAEAAGTEEAQASAGTASSLRAELAGRWGEGFARVLGRCSLLSDGSRLDGDDAVRDGALVDVLPPFAGG